MENKRYQDFDDESYSSAEDEFGDEMTAAEYKRRIRDYKQQIEELELSLENTEVEMAEDSERCEEELNKMDQLVHSIQIECTAEIEDLKKMHEKELMEANRLLEKEREKNIRLELNNTDLSAQDVSADDIGVKEQLEQTYKKLELAEEHIEELNESKEQLVQELKAEQAESIVRLEMINQMTVQMQESDKECEEKKKKLQMRISELEKEIVVLKASKSKSESSSKRTITPSSFQNLSRPPIPQRPSTPQRPSIPQRPSLSRQPSKRSADAVLRKQNSMARRQKVLDNSMKEMDDMIKAMREKAQKRNKSPGLKKVFKKPSLPKRPPLPKKPPLPKGTQITSLSQTPLFDD